ERDLCSHLKATQIALDAQYMQQTVAAITPEPIPTPTNWVVSPGTTSPPILEGTPPPDAFQVVQINKGDFVGMPYFQEADSIWKIGSVKDPNDPAWYPLYVYTFTESDERGDIVLTVLGGGAGPLGQEFEKTWTSPQATGAITMTGITDITEH